MKRLNVLIAVEHNRYKAFFSENENKSFNIAFCENNGEILMQKLSNGSIDVIVMDTFMSELDAWGVLQRLKTVDPRKVPVVVVLSSINNEFIKREFILEGADYYLTTPASEEDLLFTLNLISIDNNYKNIWAQKEVPAYFDIEALTAQKLQALGFSISNSGYRYAKTAVRLMFEDSIYVSSITKKLYPKIAEIHETTPSSVERALRHAIEVCWKRADREVFAKYFGYSYINRPEKPTNSEFLAGLTEHARLSLNATGLAK